MESNYQSITPRVSFGIQSNGSGLADGAAGFPCLGQVICGNQQSVQEEAVISVRKQSFS